MLVAFVEIGADRGDAMKVERRLKALKSKKIIANFVKNPQKLVEFAQKVLSPPH